MTGKPWERNWGAPAAVQTPADVPPGIGDDILDALRMVESSGGKNLRSPAGALGPYQLMPDTAREMGVDPFDEAQARGAARKILERGVQKFGDLDTALMAYHAGEGNVAKHRAGQPSGVGPLTLAYPAKVRSAIAPAPASAPAEREFVVGDAADPPAPPATAETPRPWERNWAGVTPKAPTILDDVKALPGKALDAITGESTTEFPDMPELHSGRMDQPFAANLKLFAGRLVSADPKQLADITVKAFPGATQKADKHGNPIVSYEGKDFYVNKPGLSENDALKFGADLAALTPATRIASWFGKLLSPVVAGLGFGATSVAEDKAAQALGSSQPVDWERAALNAGLGAGTTIALPMLGKIARSFGSNKFYDPALGKLTPAGEAELRSAGIDPGTVTGEMAERFARLARNAANPAEAARLAEAETLPVRMPSTKGDVSGSPSDQMFESLAAKGAYGKPAETVMQGRAAQKREAIQGNVGAIQDRIAGGERTITQPGQAGQSAQARLEAMRKGEKAGVTAAYDAAKETSAGIPTGGVQGVAFTVKSGIADFHPTAAPKTWAIVQDLEKLSAEVPGATPGRPPGPWEKSRVLDADGQPILKPGAPGVAATGEPERLILLRELEAKRRQLSQLRGSNDSVEATAAGSAVKAYDEAMKDLFAKDLIKGDEGALNAWRKARAANSAFADRFKGDDLIEILTETERRSGKMQLKVTPEEASNAIFGSAKLFPGANAGRDLKRLRDVLGPDSPEWQGIREEAWIRLARAGNGKIDPLTGDPAFSGAKFARAMDGVLSGGAETAAMRALFTEEELALMNQFKRVAARTTMKVEGGDNHSNTAVAASTMLQKLVGTIFTGEGAAGRFMALPIARTIYSMGAGLSAVNRLNPGLASKGLPDTLAAVWAGGNALQSGQEPKRTR